MTPILCPKCKAQLVPTGEISFGGRVMAVYQCDVCTKPWEFGGTTFDTALSFAVDGDGNMIAFDLDQLFPDSGEPSAN